MVDGDGQITKRLFGNVSYTFLNMRHTKYMLSYDKAVLAFSLCVSYYCCLGLMTESH